MKFWALFIVLSALVIAGMVAIGCSDESLAATCTPSSAALEWIASPPAARQIVENWLSQPFDARWIVTRGILIDFAFIVAYVSWFFVTLKRCAASVPTIEWWSASGDQLAKAMLFAGLFDSVENIGILAELWMKAYWLAPLTTAFAIAKWTIIGIASLYILSSVILTLRTWAAKTDEEHEELRALG